ncbi:MAG: hypothetical protein E6J91_03105 [Deltaproteobacteria bacterium]|nr:MAG: hypothetical protein E6J91_03105 [Deltaproteobacteria bacterium]
MDTFHSRGSAPTGGWYQELGWNVEHVRLGRIERHLDPDELSTANANISQILDHGACHDVRTEAKPDAVTDLDAELCLRGHIHRLPACKRSCDRSDVRKNHCIEVSRQVATGAPKRSHLMQLDLGTPTELLSVRRRREVLMRDRVAPGSHPGELRLSSHVSFPERSHVIPEAHPEPAEIRAKVSRARVALIELTPDGQR